MIHGRQFGLTKSKFYREIEILPLELPGRPAPQPPSDSPGVSFPDPPLRDWKFNVAVRTDDPFEVRGNLANGVAIVDLRLIGTGATLALDGQVRIENFVASLPFSKLEIETGFVYFSPDEPFVPRLDLQGTSNMRDYNINVYIFGSARSEDGALLRTASAAGRHHLASRHRHDRGGAHRQRRCPRRARRRAAFPEGFIARFSRPKSRGERVVR